MRSGSFLDSKTRLERHPPPVRSSISTRDPFFFFFFFFHKFIVPRNIKFVKRKETAKYENTKDGNKKRAREMESGGRVCWRILRMRIVRERGCQVAQVATLDVDRCATAWAATSVAPGGGRPSLSLARPPLGVFLLLAFSNGRCYYHHTRSLWPPSLPDWRTRKGHSTSVHKPPEDSLPAHVTHSLGSPRGVPRSLLLHISPRLLSFFLFPEQRVG